MHSEMSQIWKPKHRTRRDHTQRVRPEQAPEGEETVVMAAAGFGVRTGASVELRWGARGGAGLEQRSRSRAPSAAAPCPCFWAS